MTCSCGYAAGYTKIWSQTESKSNLVEINGNHAFGSSKTSLQEESLQY
jgi:hypothetical protein